MFFRKLFKKKEKKESKLTQTTKEPKTDSNKNTFETPPDSISYSQVEKNKNKEKQEENNDNSTPPPPLATMQSNLSLSSISNQFQRFFEGPTIKPSDVNIQSKIGEGAQGKVFKASVYGQNVAVKLLPLTAKREHQQANYKSEIELMSQASRHPNLVLFLGACLDDNCGLGNEKGYLLVTELCSGSLSNIIEEPNTFKTLTLFDKVKIAHDISLGLSWLHEIGIVHCDLKPDNILYDSHGVFKVADFGYSRLFENPHQLHLATNGWTNGGAPLYMAPERLKDFDHFEPASDVYSFAVMFWEILTGNSPYNHFNQIDTFKEAILVKQERPPLEDVKKACGDMIDKTHILDLFSLMWAQDAKKRPTFREIVPKLEQLLLEVSIVDPKARIFWKKYFFREIKSNIKESSPPSLHMSSSQVKHQPLDTKVSWKNFINAVLEEFRVIIKENHLPNDILSAFKDQKPKAEQLIHKLPDFPMRSELKVASKDALEEYAKKNEQAAKEVEFEKIRRNLFTKTLMLKSILAEQRDLDREEVHIVRFGKICDTLGPWDFKYQNGLFVGILENVAALCGQKWFFSHVTKAAANESIADKEVGTFLVRFGNTRNSFVLTKIDRDKQNKKIIASFYVISDERGFSLFEQGPWFSTIMDLINNCIKEGFVTKTIDTTHSVVDEDKIFSGQLATVENYYLQPEITVRKSNDSKETLEGQLEQLKKRKEELTQKIGTEFNQEIFAELGALFLKMEEIEMQLNTK